MSKPKRSPGRPKHVAEYATGEAAQNNFANAMRAILTPKPSQTSKKKKAA